MLFIFDMGGVVTSTAGSDIIEKICNELNISCNRFYELCEKGLESDLLKKMDNGLLGAKEFWNIIGSKLGIKIQCDYWRMFFHPILNESVVKIIKDLRKKGHRVVCGTNTIESHYDNHLSRGDYAFFDQTYTSVSMGVSKPDCDFWNKILLAEGFSSDECFFVDDKIENCEAAASLGITVFNLANFNQIQEFKKSIKVFLKNHKK